MVDDPNVDDDVEPSDGIEDGSAIEQPVMDNGVPMDDVEYQECPGTTEELT